MSQNCVFCRIVDGELPARTVTETDTTLAFLDANPLARGHALVIPKDHHARIGDLPGDLAGDLFDQLYRLVPAVQEAVDADAANVGFNDGPASGQEVPHVHGHVVPRFEGDGGRPIHAVAGSRPDLSEAELDDVAGRISSRL
jgi:histidine triad (HIT) family protein